MTKLKLLQISLASQAVINLYILYVFGVFITCHNYEPFTLLLIHGTFLNFFGSFFNTFLLPVSFWLLALVNLLAVLIYFGRHWANKKVLDKPILLLTFINAIIVIFIIGSVYFGWRAYDSGHWCGEPPIPMHGG